MDYSDNVEDGEIAEVPKEVQAASNFTENRHISPSGQAQVSHAQDNRQPDDHRFPQDRRQESRFHLHGTQYGGNQQGRQFARPPPPSAFPPRGNQAPQGRGSRFNRGNDSFRGSIPTPPYPPQYLGAHAPGYPPPIPPFVPPPLMYGLPPHPSTIPSFPRPPPAVHPPPLPPNTRPPPVALAPPVRPPQDVEMEDVTQPGGWRPPAIVTAPSHSLASTPGAHGRDNRHAIGTPMPSSSSTPTFHQYHSSVSEREPSPLRAQETTTPRASRPLINVVSGPTSASPESSMPHPVERSMPALPPPRHRVTMRTAQPIQLSRSQSTSSIPPPVATSSLTTTPSAKSSRLSDLLELSTPTAASSMSSNTPNNVPFADGGASTSSVVDIGASTPSEGAAPGSSKRPRLSWGQGLRRRTSGPVEGGESGAQGGDETSAAASSDATSEAVHELDRLPEVPSLVFGRAQSEILTPTHMRQSNAEKAKFPTPSTVGTKSSEVTSSPKSGKVQEDTSEDIAKTEPSVKEEVAEKMPTSASPPPFVDIVQVQETDKDTAEASLIMKSEESVGGDTPRSASPPTTSSNAVSGGPDEKVKKENSASVSTTAKAGADSSSTSRPKGRPGRPALSDEAKALKKAERKAKKKALAEKEMLASATKRKSSKGGYDNGEYDSGGSDWEGEPGGKKGAARRGRPRGTGDSDAESGGEGSAPKKKRGRPPVSAKAAVAATPSGGNVAPEDGGPVKKPKAGRKKKPIDADSGESALGVPVKRRSRSFGSFERDSLGSIFSSMPDLRNAYYALQGMVRIQVGMRGVDGFDKEDLKGLAEMLQNPQSVVNLPIPYTSEIMMCLDIIEAQSHRLTESLLKWLLLKNEWEELPVEKSEDEAGGKDESADKSEAEKPLLEVKDERKRSTASPSTVLTNALQAHISKPFAQTPITVMRRTYEKGNQGQQSLMSMTPIPHPDALPILKHNLKVAKVANITAHIIPPSFASKEDKAFVVRQVHSNRVDMKRNRPVITDEIRKRKMRCTQAWEILGDRYVSVKHKWEHNLKHTAPSEFEEEDPFGPRLRALGAMKDAGGGDSGGGSPRTARISALRATSDMCKSDVDQEKILQQLAMLDLKQKRLKFGIASIVDMVSPWQNADSSIPPEAPTFPTKGMVVPSYDPMGSLNEKQDLGDLMKSGGAGFPKCVLESPVIVDLNGCRLTTDGKRQMCAAQPETEECSPGCNCALQVDRIERQCRPWSDMEKCIFVDKFMQFPKNFSKIAAYLVNRTTKDCIKFYYDSKTTIPYKALLREFDNRKRHLKNSWNHTCTVATSVGGIVYPPEEVDDKEQLYELPVDDVTYHSLGSHPLFMASALGLEGKSSEEYGSYRRKKVKYMQQITPRYSTHLLNERRCWKKELSQATLGNGQATAPRFLGLATGPGSSRKFSYPSGYDVEESIGMMEKTYGGYALSDASWIEKNRSMSQVRQRKPKEQADSILITADMLNQKLDTPSLGPASPTGISRGRGRGRRGRRPGTAPRGGRSSGSVSASVSDVASNSPPIAESTAPPSSGRGRGRGRGRWGGSRGRGRGRGRSSPRTDTPDQNDAEQAKGGEVVSEAVDSATRAAGVETNESTVKGEGGTRAVTYEAEDDRGVADGEDADDGNGMEEVDGTSAEGYVEWREENIDDNEKAAESAPSQTAVHSEEGLALRLNAEVCVVLPVEPDLTHKDAGATTESRSSTQLSTVGTDIITGVAPNLLQIESSLNRNPVSHSGLALTLENSALSIPIAPPASTVFSVLPESIAPPTDAANILPRNKAEGESSSFVETGVGLHEASGSDVSSGKTEVRVNGDVESVSHMLEPCSDGTNDEVLEKKRKLSDVSSADSNGNCDADDEMAAKRMVIEKHNGIE